MASTCFLDGLCGASSFQDTLKQSIEEPSIAPFAEIQIKASDGAVIAQAAMLIAQAAMLIGNLGNPLSNLATANGGPYLALGGDVSIGVGNGAYPASIKSLQVGTSNGTGAEIEVIDQEGSDFNRIYQRISRDGTATDSLCWLRWGWVSTNCGGGTTALNTLLDPKGSQPNGGSVSQWVKMLILNVSIDYSSGTTKYKLHCSDTLKSLVDTKVSDNVNDFFRTRVENLATLRGLDVKWINPDGTPLEFKCNSGACDVDFGITKVWEGKNRSFMDCINDWTRQHLADYGEPSGRGIVIFFDNIATSTAKNGTIVFMASAVPICGGTTQTPIATYVVNGGCTSPVINFRPNIGWTGVFANTAGGGAGGASGGGTQQNRGPTQCLSTQSPQLYASAIAGIAGNSSLMVGTALALTVSRSEVLTDGLRAQRNAYNNLQINNMANLPWNAVTAELKVQGDPSYCSPILYYTKSLNVIVINPFQIGSQSCMWTNVKPCQDVLTSQSWYIEGVSHDLREGSYTTTFKLRLPTPGYDISFNSSTV